MVKNSPIQHEKTAEVYRAYNSSRECHIRAEETTHYWQNSVLESTKDYALTKAY